MVRVIDLTLLTGGDPVRDLLQWLDQGDAFRAGRRENEWAAFVEVCRSQLAFDLSKYDVLDILAEAREAFTTQEWKRFLPNRFTTPSPSPRSPSKKGPPRS